MNRELVVTTAKYSGPGTHEPTAADIIGWLSDHPGVWDMLARARFQPNELQVGQLRGDPTSHDRVVEVMAVELPGLSTHASIRNTRTGRLTRILRSTLRRWPLELR